MNRNDDHAQSISQEEQEDDGADPPMGDGGESDVALLDEKVFILIGLCTYTFVFFL